MTNRTQTTEILLALAEAEEHAVKGNRVSASLTQYGTLKAVKLREIAGSIERESQDQGFNDSPPNPNNYGM